MPLAFRLHRKCQPVPPIIEPCDRHASMNRQIPEDESAEVFELSRCQVQRESETGEQDELSPKVRSHRMRRGLEPIQLNNVEFRILKFLASKPYHAFTPRRIVEAVSTDAHPVTEATLRSHILSLRSKLGFFADYVQTVPYIGYRFKA